MPTYQEELALWSGDLFIDTYDSSGSKTGERDVGHASAFAITAPSVEKKEEIGRRRSNYGTTIKSVVTKVTQQLTITLKDINRHNLVLAMLGADSVYTQTAGNSSGSPEAVTGRTGKWVKLSNRNLDPETPPVVQDETDTDTYVEDSDYEIDYQVGRLYVLSDGDITDGETLHVASTWLDHTGYKVTANDDTTVEAYLRCVGKDQANERDGEIIVHKAQLEPSGDLNWITEEFAEIQLTGTIVTVSDGSWEVMLYE